MQSWPIGFATHRRVCGHTDTYRSPECMNEVLSCACNFSLPPKCASASCIARAAEPCSEIAEIASHTSTGAHSRDTLRDRIEEISCLNRCPLLLLKSLVFSCQRRPALLLCLEEQTHTGLACSKLTPAPKPKPCPNGGPFKRVSSTSSCSCLSKSRLLSCRCRTCEGFTGVRDGAFVQELLKVGVPGTPTFLQLLQL